VENLAQNGEDGQRLKSTKVYALAISANYNSLIQNLQANEAVALVRLIT
jgi:hypothetical protein